MLRVIGPSGGTGTVHDGGGHPERPARIDAVMAGVAEVARTLGSDLELIPAAPATNRRMKVLGSRYQKTPLPAASAVSA